MRGHARGLVTEVLTMTLHPKAAALAAVLLVGACVGPEWAPESARPAYLADAAERVAAADWSQARTVEVRLDEYAFAPSELAFPAGQPVRLRLVNGGNVLHTFGAPEFFQAVAVRRLVGREGARPAPYLVSIRVAPGESKELEFVPVTPGAYRLRCTVVGHALLGMTGRVRIE